MITRSGRLFLKNISFVIRKGSDHSHGPYLPPFGRQAPPKSKVPEEIELVWDDSVAPETCIDFDAPQASTKEVLLTFFSGIFFLVGLAGLIALSDPHKRAPVATRASVIPFDGLKYELGLGGSGEDQEEDE